MRAMHITAPGHFGFVDVPVPAVQPGYALVRPLIESLCGSDVRAVYYAAPEEYPMPIGRGGHEVTV